MAQKIQIRRTATPNNPPSGLSPGELSVEMDSPTRLWVGVPSAQDASQRKLLVGSSGGAAGPVLTVVNASSAAIVAINSPAAFNGTEGIVLLSVPIQVKSSTSRLRLRAGANFFCLTGMFGYVTLFTDLSPTPVASDRAYMSGSAALVSVNPGSGLIAHGQPAGTTIMCSMRGGRGNISDVLFVNGSAAGSPWVPPTNIWLDVEEIA